jgi:hypothetical protein
VMPRFFFDVQHGLTLYEDHEGVACANLDVARQMANDIVSELREDPELGGCQVLIIDEAGNEVLRLGTDTLH